MDLDDFFVSDKKDDTGSVIKYSHNGGYFARILKKQIPNIELLIDTNLAKELAASHESAVIIAKTEDLSWLRIVLTGQFSREEIAALIEHARKNRV